MTATPIILDSAAGPGIRKAAAPYSDTARRRLLVVFMVALLLPIQPELGGQRLDPYRLLLLLLFLPFVVALLKRRAGQFTISDGMMGAYALWTVVTLVFHHGMGRFAYASILATMLLGGYMAGRLLIRNAQDYRRFIRYFLMALLILLPFSLFELLTEQMIIAETLGKVFPATAKYYESRWGLSRVQVVFPHPILYGLFCSIGFANVLYLYRDQFFGRLSRVGLVVGMTFMALSSAPLLSIGLQSIMAGWDKITRGKWLTLFVGFAAIYIFLSLASNRGPVIILIETLTFDPSTAWWRVHIWEYGVQNVMNHPFLGLGLNDWARPYWLAPTVDNFWLVTAMRAGLPALAFLVVALSVHVFRIVRAKGLNAGERDIRTGYLVALVGIAFTISTVHVWDGMAVFLMFYIGAGSFLYTSQPEGEAGALKDTRGGARAPVVYARIHLAQPEKRPPVENSTRKAPPTYARRIKGSAAAFEGYLAAFTATPDAALTSLPLGADTMRQGPNLPIPTLRIHDAIAAMAAKTPEAPALEAGSVRLSYAALNARAGDLAGALVARGAGPGKVVGLCLERSADLIIAMLAILKTGAAYLPLDPAYPVHRLTYMIEDADAPLIVASRKVAADLGLDPSKVVFPDATGALPANLAGSPR